MSILIYSTFQVATEAPAVMDEAEVAARVQGVVTGIMGGPVAPDQPLMEAGLDSIGEQNAEFVLKFG